jgi:hypothetical protein
MPRLIPTPYLPDDLWWLILGHLDGRGSARAAMTCRLFREIVDGHRPRLCIVRHVIGSLPAASQCRLNVTRDICVHYSPLWDPRVQCKTAVRSVGWHPDWKIHWVAVGVPVGFAFGPLGLLAAHAAAMYGPDTIMVYYGRVGGAIVIAGHTILRDYSVQSYQQLARFAALHRPFGGVIFILLLGPHLLTVTIFAGMVAVAMVACLFVWVRLPWWLWVLACASSSIWQVVAAWLVGPGGLNVAP